MYDPNINENNEQKRINGEYSFSYKGNEQYHRYSDADYIPASDAPKVNPTPSAYSAEIKKPAKKRSGISFAQVVALCLICAVIGGFAGFGGALLAGGSGDDDSASLPATTETDTPATNSPATTPGTSSTPIVQSTGDGSVLSGAQIYEIACPQTVGITTEITTSNVFGQPASTSVTGSGFIISSDGYILTNYHVIEDAKNGGYDINVILHNGDSYPADIVGYEDDGTDVAVLKIDATGLSAVSIGNSDEMLVGETVYVLGNPLGELTYTLTSGMVSALDRVIATSSVETDSINVFQIDAAINSGNSGGPVFNSRGEVVGIATAKYSDTGIEGLGFAIPINDAISIANELIDKGYVSGKAAFGITVSSVTSYAAQYYNMVEGAYVYSIESNSCAEKAGLEVGDVITKIDDSEILSQTDLIVAKRGYRAGESATLTVYRNGEYITLDIIFDEELPSSGSDTQQIPEAPQTTSSPGFNNPFGW